MTTWNKLIIKSCIYWIIEQGFAYAGTILSWIDIAAGIAAKRHAVSPSVKKQLKIGYYIQIKTLTKSSFR